MICIQQNWPAILVGPSGSGKSNLVDAVAWVLGAQGPRSLRGAKMFERVGVGIVGIVENMSYFVCPDCHARSNIFLAGGGSRLAAELGVPLLGQIPLQAGMAELADRGEPIVVSQPESPAGLALRELARTVATRTAGLAPALPVTAAPR